MACERRYSGIVGEIRRCTDGICGRREGKERPGCWGGTMAHFVAIPQDWDREDDHYGVYQRDTCAGYVEHTDSYDNAFYDGGRQLVFILNDDTGSKANGECEGLDHQAKEDASEEEVAHA